MIRVILQIVMFVMVQHIILAVVTAERCVGVNIMIICGSKKCIPQNPRIFPGILCFLYLCNGFRQQVEDYGDESIFQIKIKKVLESCDMSYESIMKTADILERGRF